ncbi:MAG: hypothetical protein WD847_03080 [Pirellulales bacterium]
MKELLDIRVPEEWAQQTLGDIGQPLPMPLPEVVPPFIRQIIIDAADPRLPNLRRLIEREERRRPGTTMVFVSRQYDPDELRAASAFRLRVNPFVIDTYGEECGTEYDDRAVCAKCGAGRVQRGPLVLNTKKVPKKADIAITIAYNEWVVSERLVSLIDSERVTGCEVEPVMDSKGRHGTPRWYQLLVTAYIGRAFPPTRFGINYFQEDPTGEYACDLHDWSGLDVLSELYIRAQGNERPDIAKTTNRTGRFAGYIRPAPLLVISPRLASLLGDHGMRGYALEVAHFI